MRSRTFFWGLGVALVFSLLMGKTHALAWKMFTSQDGSFRILMPGSPQQTSTVHKSFVGVIPEVTYTAKTKNGTFSANYSVLPGIAVSLGGPNTILEKAKKGLLKESGGVENSFTPRSLGTHPGRELTFQTAVGADGKARFYLVDKTLYVLVATSSVPNDPNIAKFLNSFQLL